MNLNAACSAVLLLLLVGCSAAPAADAPEALKLYLSEAGVYRVTRADLQGLHFAGDLAHVRLTRHGADVPSELDASGGSLLFYAVPQLSTYSAADVYWLRPGDPPERITARDVQPPRGSPPPTYNATLRLEENKLYSASPLGDTHWFWQSFTAPATRTVSATLNALGAGPAQLAVSLAGATEGGHAVQVAVNDEVVGEARWQGRETYVLTATVTALRPGDNAISLRAPGAPDQAEVDFLDAITVQYPRQFVAAGDVLDFQTSAPDVRVGGFQGEALGVYDVSDPLRPQRLNGVAVTRAGGTSTLAFTDSQANRHYVAFASGAARKPDEIRAARADTLHARAQQADELIIAPAQFGAALQPLVKQRAARGVNAKLVDAEQVDDAFGDGVAEPQAIRDFIAYARAQWQSPAPRFVLLVGKASYDYHDYLNGPNKNLLPTYLVPTPHLGEAASDNWFVTNGDDDPHPSTAIGRIPAKTAAQVSTAVDKIVAYENAPRGQDWQRRAAFVADDKDSTFGESADRLSGLLPDGVGAQKIYLKDFGGDVKAARPRVIEQWNAGVALLTYVGHGSIDTWAEGPWFGADQLDALTNGSRLPILLTPTCLDGFFYHPQKDSLAEDLLFKPDGGMIAGLVPTGLSLPADQDAMMSALFAALFERPAPTLGEAILRAKQAIPADTPETREVIDTFVLLGDPALVNPFAQR